MAEWNGLGRYPEDADVNDRPEEGTLLAYVDGSYQDALKKYGFGCIFILPDGRIYTEYGNGDNPDMVIQDEQKAGGKALGMMLPYFVTILLFAGAMGLGTDMVAGEKERGTMASMLVAPIKRSSIVLGKVFALMIISGISSVVYVAVMVGFLPQMMGAYGSEGLGLSLEVGQVLMMAFLLIAIAFLYSGIIVLISVFAKDTKEASSYIMPVYMLILILGIATMFTTQNIENWYYAVPVFNTALALQGILTGDVSVMQYAVTLAETLILGMILITVIAKAFESEKVMAK